MIDKIKEPTSYAEILPIYGSNNIKELFHNIHKLQKKVEYESVRRGFREACLFYLTPNEYDHQIDKIMKDKLVFQSIQRTKTLSGFSHIRNDTEKLEQDTLILGVVTKDLDVAKNIVKAFQAKEGSCDIDNISVGEYLGYPECCRKSFSELWKLNYDPIYEIAKNTIDSKQDKQTITVENGDSNLYIHFRYFGMRIIPWFPCSFKCEESSKLAKKWINLMMDIDEKTTKETLDLIKSPSTWDLLNAQIIIKHPYFMGRATSYYDENQKIVVFR